MDNKVYRVLPTKIGLAKFANYITTGKPIAFKYVAVGDGGGVEVEPNQNQTALIHETTRQQINSIIVDPLNENQFVIESIIPEDVGGFVVREAGVFDEDGDLIFIANYPPSEKPVLAAGSGRVLRIRLVIEVSEAASVVLKIDPSVVLATRDFVEKAMLAALKKHVEEQNPHSQYALKKDLDGINVMDLMPVGKTELWHSAILPSDKWLFAGSVFDPIQYPELAKIFPNGVAAADPSDRYLRIKGNSSVLQNWQLQDDAFQGHFHNWIFETSSGSATQPANAFCVGDVLWTGRKTMSQMIASNAAGYISDGVNGVPRVANETRPKTVVIPNLIVKAK